MDSLKADIQGWLTLNESERESARGYLDGVRLLQECSPNKSLIRYLSNKHDAAKLVYELEKALGAPMLQVKEGRVSVDNIIIHHGTGTPEVSTSADGKVAVVTIRPEKVADPELTPEAQDLLDQLTQQLKGNYRKRKQLSDTLADIPTDAERKQAVDELEQLEEQSHDLASQKAALESGAPVPTPAPEPAEKPAPTLLEVKQALDNLRTRVSKERAKLKKTADAAKKAAIDEKLARLVAEQQQLELQVKHLRTQQNLAA